MEILTFENLYESMMKCKHNVMWKESVAHFTLNSFEQIIKLRNQINTNTFASANPYHFTITYPKEREIVSVRFKDRVYQRCLNDNIIYPVMTKSFIYDNCACQIGKGSDFARNRLKLHLQRIYRKYGNDIYFLKIDIKKYYPTMKHSYIENLFKSKLDVDIYSKVEEILHKQYTNDIGYNAGSQMIQIAGVSALDKLDHYIKERLRIKHYVRYMDDFILLHKNKEVLENALLKIIDKLHSIGFEISQKKTGIYKMTKGIDFLGFTYHLTNTGKVLMFVKSETIKREKKHLKGLYRRYVKGLITRDEIDQCFGCFINHISKGNSYHLQQRMKKYYKDLLGGKLNGNH